MEMASFIIFSTCLAFTLCSPCICLGLLYIYGMKTLIIKIINKIGHMLNYPYVSIPNNASPAFNTECPVCHAEPNLPVQTNCNHKFCSECFIGWWHSKGVNDRASCPCCRSEIVFLLICYDQNRLGREARRTLAQVHDYNRRYSQTNLLQHWMRFYSQDSIAIVSYIWNSFNLLPQDVKLAVLMYTIVLIIYLISPIDFLPEALLGPIGLIDDGAAIAVYVRQILVRVVESLARQGERFAA